MAHYFENDPAQAYESVPVSFTIADQSFHLESSTGVFSHDRLDTGTRLLLETMLNGQSGCRHLLDLGCGIGVIGIVLETFWKCQLTCIDISEQACRLTRKNLASCHLTGEVLNQNFVSGGPYDCIALNPPIHAGKQEIYRLFAESMTHLSPEGSFWIVMRKSHGAASAMKYLESLGLRCQRVKRDLGFWIIKAEK